MNYPREQRLFAIERNGQFWVIYSVWTDEIEKASVYPQKLAKEKIKVDIGMPCNLVEVAPVRKSTL